MNDTIANNQYTDKLHGILKNAYGDKFTHSPESFNTKIQSDTAYSKKVYGILKNAYGDKFTHSPESFNTKIGLGSKKKDDSGNGSSNGFPRGPLAREFLEDESEDKLVWPLGITADTTKPEATETDTSPEAETDTDEGIDYIQKARNIRKTTRDNGDGSESSVLMGTSEYDGKHYAYPTLFPKDPASNSRKPEDWTELDHKEAFKEAQKRGELFEFDTAEEADVFAKGSWKPEEDESNVLTDWVNKAYGNITGQRNEDLPILSDEQRGKLEAEQKQLEEYIAGSRKSSKELMNQSVLGQPYGPGRVINPSDLENYDASKEKEKLEKINRTLALFTDEGSIVYEDLKQIVGEDRYNWFLNPKAQEEVKNELLEKYGSEKERIVDSAIAYFHDDNKRNEYYRAGMTRLAKDDVVGEDIITDAEKESEKLFSDKEIKAKELFNILKDEYAKAESDPEYKVGEKVKKAYDELKKMGFDPDGWMNIKTGYRVKSDVPEQAIYDSQVNTLVDVYMKTPLEELQDIVYKNYVIYKQLLHEKESIQPTLKELDDKLVAAMGEQWPKIHWRKKDYLPEELQQLYQDLESKYSHLEGLEGESEIQMAKAAFEASARAYYLNQDPEKIKGSKLKVFIKSAGEAILRQGLVNKMLGTDIIERKQAITQAFSQDNFRLTEKEKKALEVTFGENVTLQAGGALGVIFELGAYELTGNYLGLGRKIAQLSQSANKLTRWGGKLLDYGWQEFKFQAALEAEPGTGALFHGVMKYFNKIPGLKYKTGDNIFKNAARELVKADVSLTTVSRITDGIHASTKALLGNKEWRYEMEKVFGASRDEAFYQLLTDLSVNWMFGLSTLYNARSADAKFARVKMEMLGEYFRKYGYTAEAKTVDNMLKQYEDGKISLKEMHQYGDANYWELQLNELSKALVKTEFIEDADVVYELLADFKNGTLSKTEFVAQAQAKVARISENLKKAASKEEEKKADESIKVGTEKPAEPEKGKPSKSFIARLFTDFIKDENYKSLSFKEFMKRLFSSLPDIETKKPTEPVSEEGKPDKPSPTKEWDIKPKEEKPEVKPVEEKPTEPIKPEEKPAKPKPEKPVEPAEPEKPKSTTKTIEVNLAEYGKKNYSFTKVKNESEGEKLEGVDGFEFVGAVALLDLQREKGLQSSASWISDIIKSLKEENVKIVHVEDKDAYWIFKRKAKTKPEVKPEEKPVEPKPEEVTEEEKIKTIRDIFSKNGNPLRADRGKQYIINRFSHKNSPIFEGWPESDVKTVVELAYSLYKPEEKPKSEEKPVKPSVIKVKPLAQGAGHTKGTFTDDVGQVYKSVWTLGQKIFKDGKPQRGKPFRTNEYEVLKEIQDMKHIPKIGKLIETSEGEMFEIERLNEIKEGTLTLDELRTIEGVLDELAERKIDYNDIQSFMRRDNGEIVLTDFSTAAKANYSIDVNLIESSYEKLLSPDNLEKWKKEKAAYYDEMSDIWKKRKEINYTKPLPVRKKLEGFGKFNQADLDELGDPPPNTVIYDTKGKKLSTVTITQTDESIGIEKEDGKGIDYVAKLVSLRQDGKKVATLVKVSFGDFTPSNTSWAILELPDVSPEETKTAIIEKFEKYMTDKMGDVGDETIRKRNVDIAEGNVIVIDLNRAGGKIRKDKEGNMHQVLDPDQVARITKVNKNGSIVVEFADGTTKKLSADYVKEKVTASDKRARTRLSNLKERVKRGPSPTALISKSDPVNIRQAVLKYFILGGRWQTEEFSKQTAFKPSSEEFLARNIWMSSGKAPIMDNIAEQLNNEYPYLKIGDLTGRDFDNEVISVIQDHKGIGGMIEEYEKLMGDEGMEGEAESFGDTETKKELNIPDQLTLKDGNRILEEISNQTKVDPLITSYINMYFDINDGKVNWKHLSDVIKSDPYGLADYMGADKISAFSTMVTGVNKESVYFRDMTDRLLNDMHNLSGDIMDAAKKPSKKEQDDLERQKEIIGKEYDKKLSDIDKEIQDLKTAKTEKEIELNNRSDIFSDPIKKKDFEDALKVFDNQIANKEREKEQLEKEKEQVIKNAKNQGNLFDDKAGDNLPFRLVEKHIELTEDKPKQLSEVPNPRKPGPEQDKFNKAVDKAVKDWTNQVGVDIVVVKSRADYPKNIRDAIIKEVRFDLSVPGVYDPKTKKVWIARDEHDNIEEIIKTLNHEIIGEIGIENLLGSDYKAFLNELYDYIPNEAKTALATRYGWDRYKIASEHISEQSETAKGIPFIKRLWELLKKYMRNLFGVRNTDAELKLMFDKAIRKMRRENGTEDLKKERADVYVKTEKTLSELTRLKGTIEDWKADLISKGVSKSELQKLGWSEIAKEKGTVTKSELQKWVRYRLSNPETNYGVPRFRIIGEIGAESSGDEVSQRQLAKAKKMERTLDLPIGYWETSSTAFKKSKLRIQATTGWYRGRDGEWREHKYDDVPFKAKTLTNDLNIDGKTKKDEKEFIGLLPKYFDSNWKIFKEYPELKDVEVFFVNLSDNPSVASVHYEYNGITASNIEISINRATVVRLKEDAKGISGEKFANSFIDTLLRRAIMHEVQHFIQLKEDFQRGSSLKTAKIQLHSAVIKAKSYAEGIERLKDTPEWKELSKSKPDGINNFDKWYEEDWKPWNRSEKGQELQDLSRKINALRILSSDKEEYKKQWKILLSDNPRELLTDEAIQSYYRYSSGEIEAELNAWLDYHKPDLSQNLIEDYEEVAREQQMVAYPFENERVGIYETQGLSHEDYLAEQQKKLKNVTPGKVSNVIFHTNMRGLTKQKDLHDKGKAGDEYAADELVRSVIKPEKMKHLAKYKNATLLPVMLAEKTGHNKIPLAYANYISELHGNEINIDIVQRTKAYHTGEGPVTRIAFTPQFDGEVIKGKDYFLVDDVYSSGSTLSSLKDYIEAGGGNVVGVSTLAVGTYGSLFSIKNLTHRKLISKFGEQKFNEFLFDYGIAQNSKRLTEGQAQIILRYNSLDRIADKITQERHEKFVTKFTAAHEPKESYGQLNLFDDGKEKGKQTYTTKEGEDISFNVLPLYDETGPGEVREQAGETSPTLRDLKPGEFALTEGRYTKNNYFSFTGKEKIESYADVAWLFKSLENERIENFFVLYVMPNGKPIIQHISIGSAVGTVADPGETVDMAKRLKPESIYIVHNHPSGNLATSDNDEALWRNYKNLYGDTLKKGIIMNIKTGEYGLFDDVYFNKLKHETPDKEGLYNVPVFSFNKQVFSEDYNPGSEKITGSEDIAKLINSTRLGARDKISYLILNNQNNVVANIHSNHINFSNTIAMVDELRSYIARFSGKNVVIYGRQWKNNDAYVNSNYIKTIKRELSYANFTLLDVILMRDEANVITGDNNSAPR